MATINPGLRMVRRDPQGIQIGVGPGGTIIEGLAGRDLLFVEALRKGIPDAEVMKASAAMGLSAERTQEICTSLKGLLFCDGETSAHGFRSERLLPERSALLGLYREPSSSYMSRREHGAVHVIGLGRTGAALALVLVSAGLGTILLEDDQPVSAVDVGPGSFRLVDIGLPRSAAVRRQALSVDPGCRAHVVHDGGVGGPDTRCLDLAIVIAHDAVGAQTASRFMSTDRPHLFVLVREQDGTVGPLVLPGQTACAECVERHRSANDPAWLALSQQLADGSSTDASSLHGSAQGHRPELLESAALAMALAGTGAAQALLFLDGVNRPSAWSSVMAFHPDNGRWTRAEFSTHPECGCQLQRQALATISNTASP